MKDQTKPTRHKWVKTHYGKECEKCGSMIDDSMQYRRYLEMTIQGYIKVVDWYPRCYPPKKD